MSHGVEQVGQETAVKDKSVKKPARYAFQVRVEKSETRFSYQDGEGENNKKTLQCGHPESDDCLGTYYVHIVHLGVTKEEAEECMDYAVAKLTEERTRHNLPGPAWKAPEWKAIRLDQLRTDGGTQSRHGLDQGVVEQYAEAFEKGAKFPPGKAVFDGEHYWLFSGHHRHAGLKRAGRVAMQVDVVEGNQDLAKWLASAENVEHDKAGARRTNKDKRRAVELALKAKPKESNRKIADHCGVCHVLVGNIKKEQAGAVTVTAQKGKTKATEVEEDEAEEVGGEDTPQTKTEKPPTHVIGKLVKPDAEDDETDDGPRKARKKRNDDSLETLIKCAVAEWSDTESVAEWDESGMLLIKTKAGKVLWVSLKEEAAEKE